MWVQVQVQVEDSGRSRSRTVRERKRTAEFSNPQLTLNRIKLQITQQKREETKFMQKRSMSDKQSRER